MLTIIILPRINEKGKPHYYVNEVGFSLGSSFPER